MERKLLINPCSGGVSKTIPEVMWKVFALSHLLRHDGFAVNGILEIQRIE